MLFAGPAMVDQIIVSGANFAIALFLAHRLGMSAFGQFSLVLIVLYFCIDVQRALVIAPLMTFSAQQGSDFYLSKLYPLQILTVIFLGIFCGLFIKSTFYLFPSWQVGYLVIPVIFFVVMRLLHEFIRRLLFILDQEKRSIVMNSVIALSLAVGLYFLNLFGLMTVYGVLILHALCYCPCILLLFWSTKENFKFEIDRPTLSRHWRYGRWLFAGVIATYASSNYILLTGATLLGNESVGVIKTSQYVMGGMIILFQAMESIIPHKFAKHVSVKDHRGLSKSFYATLSSMVIFCMINGLTVYLFLVQILDIFNLQNDPKASFAILSQILLSFLIVINFCQQYLLRALHKTLFIFLANMLTAIISVVISPLLIRSYGIYGIIYGLFTLQIVSIAIYTYSLCCRKAS